MRNFLPVAILVFLTITVGSMLFSSVLQHPNKYNGSSDFLCILPPVNIKCKEYYMIGPDHILVDGVTLRFVRKCQLFLSNLTWRNGSISFISRSEGVVVYQLTLPSPHDITVTVNDTTLTFHNSKVALFSTIGCKNVRIVWR